MPLTVTGSSSSKSKMRSVARYVVSETADAVDRRHSLEARGCVDDVSRDETLAFRPAGTEATTASPVLIPMRTCSASAGSSAFSSNDRLEDGASRP